MHLPGISGGAAAHLRAIAGSALVSAIAVVLLVFAFCPSLQAGNAAENAFDSIINSVSTKYSMDPLLVKAVIWNESRFMPRATGAAGETGLMQLRSCAAKDWADANGKPLPTREELFDPYLNIEVGVWFLARAISRWDGNSHSYALGLCEYNAGYSRASVWSVKNAKSESFDIPSSKAKRYVENVKSKYIEYSEEKAATFARNLQIDLGMLSLRAMQ